MGLTRCPDCGKEVSDRIANCPGCGGPLKGVELAPAPTQPSQTTSPVQSAEHAQPSVPARGFVFAKCPKCEREIFLYCTKCGKADQLAVAADGATCGCTELFPVAQCSCGTRIDRQYFSATTSNEQLRKAAQAHDASRASSASGSRTARILGGGIAGTFLGSILFLGVEWIAGHGYQDGDYRLWVGCVVLCAGTLMAAAANQHGSSH